MNLFDTVEAQNIFKSTMFDGVKYGKYFYPGRFTKDFSIGQTSIIKHINARKILPNGDVVPKYNKLNIISWRGGGKSTIAKTIFAQRLRHEQSMFSAYIGKSHDFAALQTESIKRGMMQNDREKAIFGALKPKVTEGMKESFSKKSWMTNTGALVWPRGCGQPVRGLLHDYDGYSHRLHFIVIDDLMSKENIDSEDYRQKTFEWLLTDVCESVPPPELSMDWQIMFIDTLKHNDAANERLSDMPDWKTLRIPLADDNLNSLAPMFYTDSQVRAKYDSFFSRGEQNLFYQEFMCQAVSGKDSTFSVDMFKYYDETDNEFCEELGRGEIESVIWVDPAKSRSNTAALSAVVGVGVNTVKNKIYVRDIKAGRYSPNELYEEIFAMARRLRPCHVIGIEVNSLHEFIVQPLLNEMSVRGEFYELVELKPRRMPAESSDRTHGKKGRVAGLEGYYISGHIYHNKECCHLLEAQLLSYPHPKRWDVMDAFAYIVQILEMGNRYFEAPEEDEEEQEEQSRVEESAYDRMLAQEDEPIELEVDEYGN